MFKRFDPDKDVSTSTQVKSSVQRGIKSQLLEGCLSSLLVSSGGEEEEEEARRLEIVDELFPKSNPLIQYKVGPHLMLYCFKNGEPALFQARDGPILPTLKLVHTYGDQIPFVSVRVDKGAIPFILGGANIMCPGLTNPGAVMPPDIDDDENFTLTPALPQGQAVVIYAEGKEYAIAVGVMKMSSLDV